MKNNRSTRNSIAELQRAIALAARLYNSGLTRHPHRAPAKQAEDQPLTLNSEFPFKRNRLAGVKPSTNARKRLHEMLSGMPPANEGLGCTPNDYPCKPIQAADITDAQFRMLYAAAVQKGKAERRRIPIEFRPAYPDEYLDQKQVAARFGISVRTLQRWMKLGYLPFCRAHGRVHFNWAHVMDCLDGFFSFPARREFLATNTRHHEN